MAENKVQTPEEEKIQTEVPPSVEITQTPQAPVMEEPELFAEPTPVKTEPVEPTPVEPTPVETAAPVMKEPKLFAEEAPKEEIPKEDAKIRVDNFIKLARTGATTEELAKYAQDNKDIQEKLEESLKTEFVSGKNLKFVQKYAVQSPEELYESVKRSEVIVWSDKYNMLPAETRQRFEAYSKQKQITATPQENKDSLSNDISIISNGISAPSFFSVDLVEEYKKIDNNPEILRLQTELEPLNAELQNLNDEMEYIEQDIIKSAWDTPISLLRAEIGNAKRELRREYNQKLNTYNAKLATLSNLREEADRKFEILKLQNEQSYQNYTIRLNQYNRERDRMDRFDIMKFQEQSELQAEQRQREFQLWLIEIEQKYKEMNKKPQYMTDRSGNLVAVYGSTSEVVRSASGEVLGIDKQENYTDTVTYDKERGLKIVTRTYTDGSGRLPEDFVTSYDGTTNNNQDFGLNSVIAKITNKWSHPSGGLWCGEFTDLYVSQSGLVSATTGEPVDVSDDYDSKKQYINSSEPQVWGLAVWNPEPEGKYWEYGHIGIVTGYNPNTQKVQITDYNSKGNGQKATYEINVSEINNSDGGFVSLTNPNYVEEPQYSREAINFAKNIREDENFKLTNVPKEFQTEVSNYLAENPVIVEEDDPIVKGLLDKAKLAEGLSQDRWMVRNVSWPAATQIAPLNIVSGRKSQYLRKIQFLLDEQPLEKLIEVKARGATFGALSNAELGLLIKSASFLNSAANRDKDGNITGFTMATDEFRENLEELENRYLKAAGLQTWKDYAPVDLEEELTAWVWSTLPSGNNPSIYFNK